MQSSVVVVVASTHVTDPAPSIAQRLGRRDHVERHRQSAALVLRFVYGLTPLLAGTVCCPRQCSSATASSWRTSTPRHSPPARTSPRRAVGTLTLCVWGRGRQGSLALAGSLSRRRITLIQNRGSRSPLASPCDGRTHQSSRIFPAIGF